MVEEEKEDNSAPENFRTRLKEKLKSTSSEETITDLPIEAKLGRVEPDEVELVHDLEDLKKEEKSGYLNVFPAKVKFETQETDEQVVLVLRRHPVTNWRWILMAVFMGLLPFVILGIGVLPAWLGGRYVFMVTVVWELLMIGYLFEEYLRWYFNIYVITDRRVVDIDFVHMLHREINDADLLKIEDVTVRSQGVLAAMFNFGHIYIQTAAREAVFEFLAVKEADKVASVLRLLAIHRERKLRRRGN